MTEQEWLECAASEKMLKFLRGKASKRQLRLFGVACCREVWHRLSDERSRTAIEVVEQHIDGRTDDDRLRAAGMAAEQALQTLQEQVLSSIVGEILGHRASNRPGGLFHFLGTEEAEAAHNAVDADPGVLAASAVWAIAALEEDLKAGGYSFLDVTKDIASQLSDCAPHPDKHKARQASILRDLVGNPFRSGMIDRASLCWKDATIVKLTETIYAGRNFDHLPILADALEDAGCEDAAILDHLRGPGPHVLGCWALDLLLGKH